MLSRLARNSLAALALGVAAGPCLAASAAQQARHDATGLVVAVPGPTRIVIAHDAIPGVMAAMTMPFDVRDARELTGLVAGMRVAFTLVIDGDAVHAEGVRVVEHRSAEQDPFTASRLKMLAELMGAPQPMLAVGQAVPDFSLVDQLNRPVTLSSLRGRVVAITFMYTSCALPQFCFRVANHFGALQRRFEGQIPDDLVLLTITFDPARDRPDVLERYARTAHRADPKTWRFLTGEPADVQRVCALFGVEVFQDEGLINHSSRTAIVDRDGTLVANIEGNVHTARQLGDLVESVLTRRTAR